MYRIAASRLTHYARAMPRHYHHRTPTPPWQTNTPRVPRPTYVPPPRPAHAEHGSDTSRQRWAATAPVGTAAADARVENVLPAEWVGGW